MNFDRNNLFKKHPRQRSGSEILVILKLSKIKAYIHNEQIPDFNEVIQTNIDSIEFPESFNIISIQKDYNFLQPNEI